MNQTFVSALRRILKRFTATVLLGLLPLAASAADPFKIGLILPLTGPFASTGKQIEAAVTSTWQKMATPSPAARSS